MAEPILAGHVTVDSPIGPLALTSDGTAVTGLDWGAHPGPGAPDAVLRQAAMELSEYFAGQRDRFTVPVAPAGSAHLRRVLNAMAAIPPGHTRTYGDLARELRSSPRAVGQACGRNPIAVILPCHRVVATGGLGGFSRKANRLDIKRQLLDHEARFWGAALPLVAGAARD